MSNHLDETKKPVYKKWWFWLIIIVVVIGIAGVGSNSTNTSQTQTTPTSTQTVKSEEKTEYTPEEVDRLTEKDLDNPVIFERVRKSMLKW